MQQLENVNQCWSEALISVWTMQSRDKVRWQDISDKWDKIVHHPTCMHAALSLNSSCQKFHLVSVQPHCMTRQKPCLDVNLKQTVGTFWLIVRNQTSSFALKCSWKQHQISGFLSSQSLLWHVCDVFAMVCPLVPSTNHKKMWASRCCCLACGTKQVQMSTWSKLFCLIVGNQTWSFALQCFQQWHHSCSHHCDMPLMSLPSRVMPFVAWQRCTHMNRETTSQILGKPHTKIEGDAQCHFHPRREERWWLCTDCTCLVTTPAVLWQLLWMGVMFSKLWRSFLLSTPAAHAGAHSCDSPIADGRLSCRSRAADTPIAPLFFQSPLVLFSSPKSFRHRMTFATHSPHKPDASSRTEKWQKVSFEIHCLCRCRSEAVLDCFGELPSKGSPVTCFLPPCAGLPLNFSDNFRMASCSAWSAVATSKCSRAGSFHNAVFSAREKKNQELLLTGQILSRLLENGFNNFSILQSRISFWLPIGVNNSVLLLVLSSILSLCRLVGHLSLMWMHVWRPIRQR